MSVNDTLSRLHIKAEEGVYDVRPLNFLHLNIAHSYHLSQL